jgi:glycosyltransferase involved in cell wall biosynthesis
VKVSICTPVSRPDTIRAFIQSILNQIWGEWELLAVGQGPLENPRVSLVRKIVEEISSTDNRVKYLHIDTPGCSRARNTAIREARGNILAAIDDDAEATPYWLQNMVKFFDEHPEIDFVGGSVIKPPKVKRGIGVCPSVEPVETVYDPKEMKEPPSGWDWIGCNIGMRRSVINKVGFYDDYLDPGSTFPAAGDTDFLLRLESSEIKMATIPSIVVHHTYGYRYGLRNFFRLQYNYAYGNGGLAAKLSLAGDPRGEEFYQYTRKERLTGWLRPLRPHRFLRGLYGWYIFKQAYERCLREFRVENQLLVPR